MLYGCYGFETRKGWGEGGRGGALTMAASARCSAPHGPKPVLLELCDGFAMRGAGHVHVVL